MYPMIVLQDKVRNIFDTFFNNKTNDILFYSFYFYDQIYCNRKTTFTNFL